jgi:hypothetical protein
MKLSAGLLAVVAAQDGDDRWSFYDYSIPNDGRVGHAVSGTGMAGMGGHEGNRRYCHSTLDTVKIHRWDVTMNGYFAHFNPVECIGEELFCTIEERAHFGQIIGIRAGCAQMMNHPQVGTTAPITLNPELKNHYNQEASRGNSFSQGGNPAVMIFYGIGGCLALPAQNGWDVHNADWRGVMEENYFMGTHGGYGQNQCLRFQQEDGKAQLLPFGVSVCRTCCLAGGGYFTAAGDDGPCNFYPYGTAGFPDGNLNAALFACQTHDQQACAFDYTNFPSNTASNCEICAKEMFPNFSMYEQPFFEFIHNVFMHSLTTTPFCTGGACTPELVWNGAQQIVG